MTKRDQPKQNVSLENDGTRAALKEGWVEPRLSDEDSANRNPWVGLVTLANLIIVVVVVLFQHF
jgi:hypothetical protein